MNIVVQISLILVLATLIGAVFRFLRQPLLVGYIVTGIVLGPSVLQFLTNPHEIEVFSQLGISILLFIVGLNLNPKILNDIGKSSIISGFLQVLLTAALGFFFCTFLGFETIEALYISVGLTFSSTIVVLKLLSDKGDLGNLYGRLSLGYLLIQDLVAVFVLVFAASFTNVAGGADAYTNSITVLLKGLALTVNVFLIAKYILPRFNGFLTRSSEFLFLFSLGWGFGISSLFKYAGLSFEIGALIAGVFMASAPFSAEVSNRLKPLRDFFVLMFFILLGAQVETGVFSSKFLLIIILSAFVLIVKPLIIMGLAKLFSYNKRTGFLTGVSLAQISEFSLILLALAIKNNQISADMASVFTLVGLITIAISSYMITFGDRVYKIMDPYLTLFDVAKKPGVEKKDEVYDVILFGCNRLGYDFMKVFNKYGDRFLVVDFDPEVIRNLQKMGINCIFGDVEDSDFLDEINFHKSKLIVSTIPDFDTTEYFLKRLKAKSYKGIRICLSYSIEDTISFYRLGASYVVMPHFISGKHASDLAKHYGFDSKKYLFEKSKHLESLTDREVLGHAHPHKL